MGREGTNQWSQITGLMQEWMLGIRSGLGGLGALP